jgi:predicted nucleotidyltransferase
MLENRSDIAAAKRQLLEQLVQQLSTIHGVAAVVLGGSYASRAQHDQSDLDVGLYYLGDRPFLLADIQRVAEQLAQGGAMTVTGFYEWGAWVNGGAWIHTPQGKVDFLYRNLEHVQRTIGEAQQGVYHHDYDQQPTHGFYSVIYLAETQICIPLYDPAGVIADLKRQVATYPAQLKARIIADALWSAEFTLLHARNFAAQGDVYNTAGCLSRAAANLTQMLFALNERYFMRDKQVLETVAHFPHLPAGYVSEIKRILARPGSTASELTTAVNALEKVWSSVAALPGAHYTPKFAV